jgi:hypothetical protein
MITDLTYFVVVSLTLGIGIEMIKETAMSKDQPTRRFDLVRTIKKFFLSAFVVFTFVAYALHERFVNSDRAASAIAPPQRPAATQQVPASPQVIPTAPQVAIGTAQTAPTASSTELPTAPQPAPPTAQTVPTPPAVAGGLYKDGQYVGDEVDAFYGLVQVQAVIQGTLSMGLVYVTVPAR